MIIENRTGGGGRIEYIDAMRGLAMFMVVMSHVTNWGVHVGDTFTYGNFYNTYLMLHLFFFICGFVFYHEGQRWSLSSVWKFLKGKLSFFIVSPLLFAALLCYVLNENWSRIILDPSKFGYWFTFSLLQYYVLFIICDLISSKLNLKDIVKDTTFILFAFVVYGIPILSDQLNLVSSSNDIFSILHLGYYPFFVFGFLVRKHFTRFQCLLDMNWFTFVVVMSFIVFSILPDMSHTVSFLLYGFSGVVLVFALFRKHQQVFSQETVVGRGFQFIGRRTLDIYFIHYFFVQSNLQNVLPDFSKLNSPLVEFIVTFVLSCIIVSLCLLVSAILRVSPVMAHVLFGAKKYK